MKQANAASRGAVGVLWVWTEHDERLFAWQALARINRTPGMRWLSLRLRLMPEVS